MGGSKKVTVGYWYKMLLAYGWCKGPIDAFLELRGGGRTAWKGVRTETGRIYVDALELWGGKKREGGLQGYFDVQLGEADQGVNDYLRQRLGPEQPTYRGKAIGVWRGGKYGAMNPYPKPLEFKLRRILRGWDNDQPWYPEKAAIMYTEAPPDFELTWTKTVDNPYTFTNPSQVSGWSHNPDDYSTVTTGSSITWPTGTGATGIAWLHISVPGGVPREFHLDVKVNYDDSGKVIGVSGVIVGGATAPPIVSTYPRAEGVRVVVPPHSGPFSGYVAFACVDARDIETGGQLGTPTNHRMLVSSVTAISTLYAMNPAHIIYDSLTASDMQGEPAGMINDASFIAAADQLFSEGFGLCTTYDPDAETIEEFQQRICNIIGGALTQSRVNGQYYLDLIRDGDNASLPVITADDILELKWEPVSLGELVNQVTVEWFDPEQKEHRSTPPVQSLGAIQAAGRTIPEVMRYPEIPSESLALRVAARDLQARSTPLARASLVVSRRSGIWALRPGQKFRLQSPQDGINDVVCVLGDIDVGTLTSGRITIKAVQDVFGMPNAVYVDPEPGRAPPQNLPPAVSPHQRLIEAPYIELVANLSSTELEAIPDDAGAIMTMAGKPVSGLNYSLWSASEGAELENNGTGDWCPVAKVTEDADYLDTEFELTEGSSLEDVGLGSWALWDDEIVRVDAIDPEASTVTLGRGCADTVPHQHEAGSIIYFCGDWGATDDNEYVDGETVKAKLATRTSQAELSLDATPELSVEMQQRQLRPYPPAGVKINSQDYPETVSGDIVLSWLHRDRQMQADKLIDTSMASIGPEPGTAYTAEFYAAGGSTPLAIEDGITGTESALWTPPADGNYRLELFSERAGIPSWQRFVHSVMVGEGGAAADPHWDNVVSLLHFDGDLVDETGRHTWINYGATVSNTAGVFGGGAVFNGSTQRITTAGSPDFTFSGDFTLEVTMEAYSASPENRSTILTTRSKGNGTNGFTLIIDGNITFMAWESGVADFTARVRSNSPIEYGKRYRIAVSRKGGVLRLFLDGVLQSDIVSDTTTYIGSEVLLGWHGAAFPNRYLTGMIDELRITNGVARYTENFSSPTAPFPNG